MSQNVATWVRRLADPSLPFATAITNPTARETERDERQAGGHAAPQPRRCAARQNPRRDEERKAKQHDQKAHHTCWLGKRDHGKRRNECAGDVRAVRRGSAEGK